MRLNGQKIDGLDPRIKDMRGLRFDRLFVKGFAYVKYGNAFWICQCDCGSEKAFRGNSLRAGSTKSCGCYQEESFYTRKEMSGEKIGRLTIIEFSHVNKQGRAFWKCRCECEKVITVCGKDLRSENTRSCGCTSLERIQELNKLPHAEADFNHCLATYKRGARIRNLDFQLSQDQFRALISSNCHYCSKPPQVRIQKRNKNGWFPHNGIDRVDNRVGYLFYNCVACCFECNDMKRAWPLDVFLRQVKNIYEHTILRGI